MPQFQKQQPVTVVRLKIGIFFSCAGIDKAVETKCFRKILLFQTYSMPAGCGRITISFFYFGKQEIIAIAGKKG